MKRINYKDIYPVHVKEIQKDQIKIKEIDEICQFFVDRINKHPFAKNIGIFDHCTHTKEIEGGEIASNIKEAKNILFGFGKKIA
ncbi:MAG: hypothetical protein U9O87_01825 [Verrucomicrobiota bacterium]|nr:hypothetical protein [Verrucomicrobiota bacterium]